MKKSNNWKPEYAEKYRLKHPEQVLYSCAKQRAKRRKIPFNITREDIIIPEFCPILGVKLESERGKQGGSAFSPSVDRIIPDLGYVKGNIQVISLLANKMKSNANKEQLLKFAKWAMENIHD